MIAVNHDVNLHRFTTDVDGYRGVLNYTLADGVMTITHTGVPHAIGGRGIAAQLMGAALKVAGAAGWRIDPACSYAAAYLRRHIDERGKQHEEDQLAKLGPKKGACAPFLSSHK